MKTYQVQLPKWLEKYIKHRADLYDLSFSEVIRIQICLTILAFQSVSFPEYKADFSFKDVLERIKKKGKDKDNREETLEFVSKIYFETRKALDYQFEHLDRFKGYK
jgi:hypothetical protein